MYWPVGKPHAVMGADIIDGKEALAKVKNRQASAAGNDGHSLAVREVGQGTYGNTSGHREVKSEE